MVRNVHLQLWTLHVVAQESKESKCTVYGTVGTVQRVWLKIIYQKFGMFRHFYHVFELGY
jgi:hypothetical protein